MPEREFVHADRSTPLPSSREQPSPRSGDRPRASGRIRRCGGRSQSSPTALVPLVSGACEQACQAPADLHQSRSDARPFLPALEPRTGRACIDARERNPVLARILEHVDECATNFGRVLQHVGVVAVREDPPGALPQSVERSRDAHEQALYPECQGFAPASLDEHVQVIRLDRVVDDAHGRALLRGTDREEQHAQLLRPAQTRQSRDQPRRYVHRVARRQRCACRVGDERALALRLPARPAPRSAPGAREEFGLHGPASRGGLPTRPVA